MKNFHAILDRIMTERDLGAREISDMLTDVSHDTVNRWRKGEQSPRLVEVEELATALEMPIARLLGLEIAEPLTADQQRVLRLARYHGYQEACTMLYDAIEHPTADPRDASDLGRRKQS